MIDRACIALAVALALVVVALLAATRRPPPVVGRVLPFPDPKRRTSFRSRRKSS